MTDSGEDPRSAFLRGLPRKLVEIKATLGALIADPRSSRMRDELRRRLHSLFTLARSYTLPVLSEAIKSAIDLIDATRSAPQLGTQDLDRLTLGITSFGRAAESDAQTDPDSAVPGTEPIVRRSEISRVPTLPSPLPMVSTAPSLVGSEAPISQHPTLRPPVGSVPPGPGSVPPGRYSSPPSSLPLAGSTSVLFAGSHARAATLRGLLPADVEIVPTVELRDAVARSRDSAPDVVVAETDAPADGVALLQSLRRDPLTDFIPVVLIASEGENVEALRARCPDAADVLSDGADASAVRAALERALTGGVSLATAGPDFGELTLDELTRALQDELRRGLVGAATPRARTARVAMGAGSEVLAATWEAIARIRSAVEKRSAGQVRFDQTAAPRGLPGTHVFSLGDDAPHPDEVAGEDPLPGRRALVVDDDVTVVGQFSSLLREAGMEVHEHTDGAEALKAARKLRPDVVIADILMPGLDGFALCRAIRRDVALRHTPVILLSWKDDLLVRMRELGAQAQGYLRKEARGESILARVRAVLRSRVRVLHRISELAPGVETRGRVERVGTFPLVETTSENLHDATLTISDATSVTDLEIRDGSLVSAVRTFQDGRMVRGFDALLAAVGAASGRFAVRRSKGAVRPNLTGELGEQLRQTALRIAALEEAVTGAAMLEVGHVEIDRDAAVAFGRSLPAPMRALVERLMAGELPRDMVLRDGVAPSDLEPLLIDLARRGAIQAVIGQRGEDLVGLRLSMRADSSRPPPARSLPPRSRTRGASLQAPTMSLVPPPEPARASTRPKDENDEPQPGTLADAVWRELQGSPDDDAWGITRDDPPPPARIVETPSRPIQELPSLPSDLPTEGTRAMSPVPPAPAIPSELREVANSVRDSSALLDLERETAPDGLSEWEGRYSNADPPTLESVPEAPDLPPPPEAPPPQEAPPPAAEASPVEASPPADALPPAPAPDAAPAQTAPPELILVPDAEETPPPVDAGTPPAPRDDAPPVTIDDRPEPPRPRVQRTTHVPDPPARTQEGLPVLLVGMLFAGLASFGVVHWWLGAHPQAAPEPDAVDAEVIEIPARPAVVSDAAALRPPSPTPASDASAVVAVADVATAEDSGTAHDTPYVDPAPFMDGGIVPVGMGLLVVRGPHPGASPVEVQVDQRVLGNAPLQQWMGEGLHTIRYRNGVITSYQFATVRSGRAVVISPPGEH